MSRKPSSSDNFHALLLEPILTPSAILDGFSDETLDVDDFEIESINDIDASDMVDDINLNLDDFEILDFASSQEPEYTGGVFTVGESGTVEIDYLFDGGLYSQHCRVQP